MSKPTSLHHFDHSQPYERMPVFLPNTKLNPKTCIVSIIVEGLDVTKKVHEIDLSKGMLSLYDPDDINPETAMPFPAQWVKPGEWTMTLKFQSEGVRRQPFETRAEKMRNEIIGRLARGNRPSDLAG